MYERRLLNVVEEMASASGVPIPEVWILDDESAINAFAAGTDPANAVIGVTRGTLERLNRAELQGVVAHEFSHILNGDMKLNMRLMGWIFGLVMLSMVGRLIFQSVRHFRGSRNSKSGGVILGLIFLGLVVWLVGSIGVLFARMIQAAISRQREYLADASAVQFTRLPDGIAGALKKIGGFPEHGRITSPAATEARHMFFAGSSFGSLMATHPPLEMRIKAIEPRWNGEMMEAKFLDSDVEFDGAMGFSGQGSSADPSGNNIGPERHTNDTVQSGALFDLHSVDFSKDQAKSLLLGLLVSDDGNGFGPVVAILKAHGCGQETVEQVLEASRQSAQKSSSEKLAIVDLALTWLKRMEAQEARDYVVLSQTLINADGQVDLFEFVLQQVIRRHVEIGLGLVPVPAMKYRKLVDLEIEVSNLMAAFGQVSGGANDLDKAFDEYRQHTGRDPVVVQVGLDQVAAALRKMDAATPLVKQQILRLCSLIVMEDGKVEDAEIELLRATAEAMGSPFPPMVRLAA
jgi:Zn-dependent protease with chaperone function